ncbi:hypothetical protein FB451DRAFT_1379457 [Mycena latifolia]|nr:hypothetical protein FB451DRAFT_1379457 [Mycena latifolia]
MQQFGLERTLTSFNSQLKLYSTFKIRAVQTVMKIRPEELENVHVPLARELQAEVKRKIKPPPFSLAFNSEYICCPDIFRGATINGSSTAVLRLRHLIRESTGDAGGLNTTTKKFRRASEVSRVQALAGLRILPSLIPPLFPLLLPPLVPFSRGRRAALAVGGRPGVDAGQARALAGAVHGGRAVGVRGRGRARDGWRKRKESQRSCTERRKHDEEGEEVEMGEKPSMRTRERQKKVVHHAVTSRHPPPRKDERRPYAARTPAKGRTGRRCMKCQDTTPRASGVEGGCGECGNAKDVRRQATPQEAEKGNTRKPKKVDTGMRKGRTPRP